MPPVTRTDPRGAFQPAGTFSHEMTMTIQEDDMGMVMVRCPRTGHAIPTGIKTDRESFNRRPVFFSRTRCVLCHADHPWFARDAWVDEPAVRLRDRGAVAMS